MSTMVYDFKIVKGKIKCEYGAEFERFKALNEGGSGELSFKIIKIRGVKYWRHKLYRSVYLPYIAREAYSGDKFKAHVELKKMYLFVSCEEYSDIPEKHKDSRTIFIFGTKDGDRLRGYLPSLANITDDEMIEFLKVLEVIMSDMQISFNELENEIRERAKTCDN